MKNKIYIILLLILTLLVFNYTKEKDDIDYNNSLVVNYLDVGQGDCELIQMPNGKTMLIDGGETDKGEYILKYIKSRKIKKIDYLIATHPHSDHIGGLSKVVESFDIGEIYMPKIYSNTKTYEDLLYAIKNKNLKIKSAQAGMNILNEDGISADILAPDKIDEDNINNCSIVIMLKYKNNRFLFMGDAEKEVENKLYDVNANVLKVGHHGSSTSSTKTFLKRVAPEIAVISCAKNNSYNHPHKQTLKKLKSLNCEVLRTDILGNIRIISDGNEIFYESGF